MKKKIKIGILGAGISGLSIGKLLTEDFEVELLDKSPVFGGIAKTKSIEGISYHKTGGHCFNSKYPDVLDFVFQHIMPSSEWHKVTRDAAIRFKDNEISYPIEFAVKQISSFDNELAINIVKDFLNAKDDGTYENLEDWFRKKFGNTLTEEYFLPYNRKIWNRDPKEMDPSWVKDKLPIPDVKSFFQSLIGVSEDKMPHSEFYYPNSNNQNTFIDNLASGLNIKQNVDVKSIYFNKDDNKWIVNGIYSYDKLISTLPLNELPTFISNCPKDVIHAAKKLKYNKVSTMLWETKPTKKTWTYLPDSNTIFHRYIHIGNFFAPKMNYTITETIGERSYEEMETYGKKDPFLIRPLDYHVSNHAYVVFDDNYKVNKEIIFDYLNSIGIYSIGRFGEWEYYNMDVCIKRAIDLKEEIFNNINI
ncbi:protoporphyrinogen/coproporphyrinogen oxidase [Flavobacterium ajazii]|uniref:protoporphyrinogen/coproporphyrinogen oxidase n=1 Tax=Flavobacterium ajazii TaxID=2692318 RepID=UPI001CB70922|nr:NAD(P)-binding protein [Flavobacterium ajazii]